MPASVVAFVPSVESAPTISRFAAVLREGRNLRFLVYDPRQSGLIEEAIRKSLDTEPSDSFSIITLESQSLLKDVLKACRVSGTELLVSGVFNIQTSDLADQTSKDLVRSAPCRTALLACDHGSFEASENVLVLANGGPHDLAALSVGACISNSINARTVISILEPDSGTKAEQAGQKAISMLLHDASLDEEDFVTNVVVDDDPDRGIRKCLDGCDFVIVGADSDGEILHSVIDTNRTTLVFVKRAPPLRLRTLPEWIPRINPRDHADLLQDLRHGSRWRADFVAMLGLASAIASLGMMQNSPAVVIGSMLLAPLMTPMIGLGLALTQANQSMARMCWKSILLGFFLTLGISCLMGLITPVRETLSPEVLARGEPNVLDLLIAVFAAVAATTAMARPNISGAIAGVAIATALVPPICAVGLSLSRGEFGNGLGALALFVTNLVAIIITSSLTFSLLGITTSRSTPRSVLWSIVVRWSLVVVLVLLAGPLSFALVGQLREGRTQAGVHPVTRAVSRALHDRVDQDEGIEIAFLGRSSIAGAVVIQLAAAVEVPSRYGDELRSIVREQMDDPTLDVYVICLDGQWLNKPAKLPE